MSADFQREYTDAIRRLVSLPHPDAIPASWRPDSTDVPGDLITLTDVVDLICRHVRPNSVGAPGEDVHCDDTAPIMYVAGQPHPPKFCRRAPGHSGWHRDGTGTEWIDSAEHAAWRAQEGTSS